MRLFDRTLCLLIVLLYAAVGNAARNEPTGCSYSNKKLVCDYARWDPPISDSDLSNINDNLLHKVVVENVDGAIRTQVYILYIFKMFNLVFFSFILMSNCGKQSTDHGPNQVYLLQKRARVNKCDEACAKALQ